MYSPRDNFSRFLALREKYPRFSFDDYAYYFDDNGLNIHFIFNVSDSISFTPVIKIPWQEKMFLRPQELSADVLDSLVFNIGMIELVSYWKATCSPTVMLPGKKMSSFSHDFWKKLYFHGLGEFFYMNGITTDIKSFMALSGFQESEENPFSLNLKGPPIVPVGGGKDSAVTLGMMNRFGLDYIPFSLNPMASSRDVIRAAGKGEADTLAIIRPIDPRLLELNNEGYLNGHTPFSAVIAFYSLLGAYLSGSGEIILSNESSANEATIPGTRINHQYSKTYEFEKDFREYVSRCISPDFDYFSLLRPLTELQIARIFSGLPRFFGSFNSCNVGGKSGIWCGNCPKCLFTRIILSPFMNQEQLKAIFGRELLNDMQLRPILDELTGMSPVKPFECIGTIDEVNEAIAYAIRHFPDSGLPALLRYFSASQDSDIRTDESFRDRLMAMEKDHFVKEKYLMMIRKMMDD